MVEPQPSKLMMRVRFPLPAPYFSAAEIWRQRKHQGVYKGFEQVAEASWKFDSNFQSCWKLTGVLTKSKLLNNLRLEGECGLTLTF